MLTKKYKAYSVIRTDGVYVESGENDNLIVQKLTKNEAAIGIFGYSFLEENKDKVVGVTIDNIAPTADTISSGKYPVARSMYFYIKNQHSKDVSGLMESVLYQQLSPLKKESLYLPFPYFSGISGTTGKKIRNQYIVFRNICSRLGLIAYRFPK